jgi:hypothetical protein
VVASIDMSTAPLSATMSSTLMSRSQADGLASSWQQKLPASQQTEAQAASVAALWLSNPANKMMLPSNIAAADADGDGTIDKEEFKELLAASGGAGANAAALFAQIDADGDGELTEEELRALADSNRGKFKAQN